MSRKVTRFADDVDADPSAAQEEEYDQGSSADVSSNHHQNADGRSDLQRLAGRDNRNVLIWKTMVVLIISIAGALVSTGIYFYLKDQEADEVRDSVSTRS